MKKAPIMPPFTDRIQAKGNLPVFDMTMIASLAAESFSRKTCNSFATSG
jgi:hypothetical protein